MGGVDTEVTDGTTRVLLESASFKRDLGAPHRAPARPALRGVASVRARRRSRARGVRVGARGAPAVRARRRQGRSAMPVDAYPGKREVAPIRVRLPRVQMLTGVPLTERRVPRRARAPRLHGRRSTTASSTVTPPSSRTDVTREVDVIEEILRITGYEQVPSTLPALRQAPPMRPADRADVARARARRGRRLRGDHVRLPVGRARRLARPVARPIAARSRSRSATR